MKLRSMPNPTLPATYYVKTFGCQMNYADSEKVNMVLLQSGLMKVLDPAKADVVVLNTCSVRQKGEDRVFGYAHEIKKLSESLGKEIAVGITGCMVRKTGIAKKFLADTERKANGGKITLLPSQESVFNWDDDLLLRTEYVDFVFRIEETGHLPKLLSVATGHDVGNDEKWEEYLKMRQSRENRSSANVIIQTGCDNFCSFCIVPHTRGRETSRPLLEIVEEVREAVSAGAKEVCLLGQNVNSYGKETRAKLWNPDSLTWNMDDQGRTETKTPFRELLEAVGSVEGLDRIRFTSSNPHDMTRDILDAHFEVPAMTPYLHIALQSGSDAVLKRMNRKHTYADFLSQIRYLRSKDPLFSISTDIIVGFPGETEEEFVATLRAMEECEFDFVFLARYSARRGTFATDRIGDDVPSGVKADRWNRANALLETLVRKRNAKMIGRTEEILITGKGRTGGLVGRTRNFKEVFLPEREGVSEGSTVIAKIEGMDDWVLKGSFSVDFT